MSLRPFLQAPAALVDGSRDTLENILSPSTQRVLSSRNKRSCDQSALRARVEWPFRNRGSNHGAAPASTAQWLRRRRRGLGGRAAGTFSIKQSERGSEDGWSGAAPAVDRTGAGPSTAGAWTWLAGRLEEQPPPSTAQGLSRRRPGTGSGSKDGWSGTAPPSTAQVLGRQRPGAWTWLAGRLEWSGPRRRPHRCWAVDGRGLGRGLQDGWRSGPPPSTAQGLSRRRRDLDIAWGVDVAWRTVGGERGVDAVRRTVGGGPGRGLEDGWRPAGPRCDHSGGKPPPRPRCPCNGVWSTCAQFGV